MKSEGQNVIKQRGWQFLKLIIVAAIIAGIAYKVKFSPTLVTEYHLDNGAIVSEVMGTGTLEARVKATISSKISGLISEVLVDQGDWVKKGDLLVELDDAELKQLAAIAQANLAAKEAAIERLTTDKKRGTAILTQATQLLDRMQKAIETRAISQTDMEKSTETFAIAEAGLARAEAAITEGQKELITAEKTLQYHKAELANTKVLAPFDGLIVRRQRDPGDIVLPGSEVLKLVSTEQLWVSAWVDETEMAKVNAGQMARVVFRSEPERPYIGEVARLGRETDRETREFIVDVSVLESPENWAVGQRAVVYIEAGRKNSALLVPSEYVKWRDAAAGVFIHTDHRAKWHPIKLGLRNDKFIEVLGGLVVGDAVVIAVKPKTFLTDGQKISVR